MKAGDFQPETRVVPLSEYNALRNECEHLRIDLKTGAKGCKGCMALTEERDKLRDALMDVEYDLNALRANGLKVTEFSFRTQAAIKKAFGHTP